MCAADATGHLLLGQFPGPPCWDGKTRTWWWSLNLRAPQPCVLCCQLGQGPRQHHGGEETQHCPTRHRAVRKAEHSAELAVSEAKLWVSTAKPRSRNPNRVRQLTQHGCEGEHKHPALESSRTGRGSCGRRKEGKFPLTGTGQGRLSAVRAGEASTGCHREATNKITTYQKGQRA